MVLVSKMYKNILIIGAARSGKTTLAKKIAKEKGISVTGLKKAEIIEKLAA